MVTNDVARDLWSQLVERYRKHEWATFWDETVSLSEPWSAEVRAQYRGAGWTDKDIAEREADFISRIAIAPETTPDVSKATEIVLQIISNDVKEACRFLGHHAIDGAHFVVEPFAGPIASKISAFVEDQSIIALGAHFTRYCGLVARAYVRTMQLAPFSTGLDGDIEHLKQELQSRPDLLSYWASIFLSYAATGTHVLCPFRPCSPNEVIHMEQMAYAMEVYAISHEVGHHILRHGKDLNDSRSVHEQELEADAFAISICESIHPHKPFPELAVKGLINPYLFTGAGGILLLKSLSVFRALKHRLFNSTPSDTHPNPDLRCQKIMNRSVIMPAKHMTITDFCMSVETVISAVTELLHPIWDEFQFKAIAQDLPGDWEKDPH